MQNCEEKLEYKQADGASVSISLLLVHILQDRTLKNYIHNLYFAFKKILEEAL